MPTQLPREPSGNSPLHDTVRKLIRCLKERTILESDKYGIEHHSDGVFLRFKQVKQEGGGGGDFNFRGMWEPFEEYKKNDVVMIRAGQATEGNANYNHGTFFCVLDHTADEENRPKEPTINTGGTSLDPLASTGPTDIWRTLAQGHWNDFIVSPFAGGLPENLIPFNYARMVPGTVSVSSGTPAASKGASLSGGVAVGSSGPTSWIIDVSDLPVGKQAKFRLVTLCIGGEKFTAYMVMTAPEAVP